MLPFQQKTLIPLEIVLHYVTFPTKDIDVRNCTRLVTFPTKDIDVRNCTRLCYLSNKLQH